MITREHRKVRRGLGGAALALVVVAAMGCTKTDTPVQTSSSSSTAAGGTTSTAAAETTTTAKSDKSTTTTSKDDSGDTTTTKKSGASSRKEDSVAESGLITKSDLPDGTWSVKPPSKSANDSPSFQNATCSAISDKLGELDKQTGKAKVTFTDKTTGIDIEDSVDLYADEDTGKILDTLLGSDQLNDCFKAAIEKSFTSDSTVKVTVEPVVTTIKTPSASDLGVDSVAGIEVTATLSSQGTDVAIDTRLIVMRSGRGSAVLSVSSFGVGAPPPSLDSIDPSATLKATVAGLKKAVA